MRFPFPFPGFFTIRRELQVPKKYRSQIQATCALTLWLRGLKFSAVRALFGEIQNHAKLPVTLPGIAARGFSLPAGR
jgi:hypothetical protein